MRRVRAGDGEESSEVCPATEDEEMWVTLEGAGGFRVRRGMERAQRMRWEQSRGKGREVSTRPKVRGGCGGGWRLLCFC